MIRRQFIAYNISTYVSLSLSSFVYYIYIFHYLSSSQNVLLLLWCHFRIILFSSFWCVAAGPAGGNAGSKTHHCGRSGGGGGSAGGDQSNANSGGHHNHSEVGDDALSGLGGLNDDKISGGPGLNERELWSLHRAVPGLRRHDPRTSTIRQHYYPEVTEPFLLLKKTKENISSSLYLYYMLHYDRIMDE